MEGKGGEHSRLECEVGGVHHVVYKCTPNVHHIVRTRVGERGMGRDGRVFPYVAHYLSTGDMLYPAHEGEAMVGRLMDELTQLDLVDDLLHSRASSTLASCVPSRVHSQASRRFTVGGGDGDTLRVHTRRRRRITFANILHHLLPVPASATASSSSSSASAVYRPPSNKGTTLVVSSTTLHRSTEVTVHGPKHALRALFPGTPVLTAHATYPLLDSRAAPRHHGTAHDLLAAIKEEGYSPTVRSSWVVGHTGALVTQWLVHKRRAGWALHSSSTKTLLHSKSLHHGSSKSLFHANSKSHHHASSKTLQQSSAKTFHGSSKSLHQVNSKTLPHPTSKTLPRRPLHHSTNSISTLEAEGEAEGEGEGERAGGGGGGTLRHKLRARSKSIMSLATEHRPTLTLKRILSVLL